MQKNVYPQLEEYTYGRRFRVGVKSWFSVLQNAIHDFVSDERIVWVDIEGIPLNLWSLETFTRIAKKWGEVVDIEDNVDSSFGRKRICMSSTKLILYLRFWSSSRLFLRMVDKGNTSSGICAKGTCRRLGIPVVSLCVWEASVFKKDYATLSDNFIAIYGTWLPSNSKVLFVAIYAPQHGSSKRMLWDYMATLISHWNGEVIMLGDFNEVSKFKEAFFNHFEARFKKLDIHRLVLNFTFDKRLSIMQAADLDRVVSRDEIRLAVWDCGENKSPGPDGYSFEFFKKYWNLVGSDLCDAIEHFFDTRVFPNGCNSSFVALIPKVTDAKFVNDFRPISLIGSMYKIVTKVLANRLALPLRIRFPRLFALEMDKEVVVAIKMQDVASVSFRRPVRAGTEHQQMVDLSSLLDSVTLSQSFDRWTCDLTGDGEFRVKEIRNSLDNLFLPSHVEPTRWVKCIPIKINVFAWKARRDFLPTRVNLARRGIALESYSCPLCSAAEEDINHILFGCDLAHSIFRRICRWWDLNWQVLVNFSEWSLFLAIRLRESWKVKLLLEGVFNIAWWFIWGSGTVPFSMRQLLEDRSFSTILFLFLLIGALVDVIGRFHGILGLKTLTLFPCNVLLASC
ncbi:RNA-directed DNA polymerase, eukaryota [Tanacetum coccineum]|uniref:RNA-directed DNA polymerase, eukaryota n=1 Tax=Tanacetum coccineum TaxID=301880 RepID=A0ABQ5AX12_9ASTR